LIRGEAPGRRLDGLVDAGSFGSNSGCGQAAVALELE
jgi:hypothetical protein